MKRILTAIIAIPVALAVTFYAPKWLFAGFDAALAALMIDEYFKLTRSAGGTPPGRWFLLPAGLVAASFAGGIQWIVISLAIAVLCLMTSCLFTGVDTTFLRISAGLSGVLYCSFLFGFLIFLSRDSVLLLLVIIWT